METIRDILMRSAPVVAAPEREAEPPARAVSDTFDALRHLFRKQRKGDAFQVVFLGDGKVHVIRFTREQ